MYLSPYKINTFCVNTHCQRQTVRIDRLELYNKDYQIKISVSPNTAYIHHVLLSDAVLREKGGGTPPVRGLGVWPPTVSSKRIFCSA